MVLNRSAKRIRGPTTCKELWSLQTNTKKKVRCNIDGQPIGDNASKLSSFLGTIARSGAYAPLNYEDWRIMPSQYKDDMWSIVEVNLKIRFDIQVAYMNEIDIIYT